MLAVVVAGYYFLQQNKQQSNASELKACLASCDRNINDIKAPYYSQALEGCHASCQTAAVQN